MPDFPKALDIVNTSQTNAFREIVNKEKRITMSHSFKDSKLVGSNPNQMWAAEGE